MPSENAPSLCRVARSRNHFCAEVEWKQDEGVYYGILAMGRGDSKRARKKARQEPSKRTFCSNAGLRTESKMFIDH